MQTIDKLIIKAKKKHGSYMLTTAFISPTDNGQYTVVANLWKGIPGKGTKNITMKCGSIVDAEHFLNNLAEKYPNKEDVVVIIDDLEE